MTGMDLRAELLRSSPDQAQKLMQRCLSLRQIVPEKYLDADSFLVGNDRLAQAVGQQNSGRGAGFVAGILIDDGVDQAAEQKSSGVGGQFMRDPDDVLHPARCL